MRSLMAALCLVLVIEGLTLLVAPARWQAMMREALKLPPRILRVVGAVAVVSGLLLLQLFH